MGYGFSKDFFTQNILKHTLRKSFKEKIVNIWYLL